MKKFVNELSPEQSKVYTFITKNVTDDGGNIIEILLEVSEWYESIPEKISDCYGSLSEIEKIEVIHFVTRYILKKN
ncbi:hypothetical protein [Brevibacillus brevis]|uniref:hypothetical protein n=1 Tax=Brevibacillus brevis TaxID=1393 RepID=UPI0007D8B75C|nr:hypothetical protein [Brevibacillus brevis]